MYVIICGGGGLGSELAKSLIAKHEDVVVVDSNAKVAKSLANNLDALVINGSATDSKVLEEAGIDKAEVLVAATGDDTKNLMICQLAKKHKVGRVITRVNESSNLELFVGIADVSIDLTSAESETFTRAASIAHEHVLTTIGGGRAKLLQIPVTENSPVRGKDITQIELGDNGRVVTVDRGGEIIFRFEDLKALSGDILYVIGKTDAIHKINKKLTGV